MTESKTGKSAPIPKPIRVMVVIFGLLTWLAGGVATFLVKNGVGQATMIIVGAFALLLAGVGRWPTKIIWNGNEINLEERAETAEANLETQGQIFQQRMETVIAEFEKGIKNASSPAVANSLKSLKGEIGQTIGMDQRRLYNDSLGKALAGQFPQVKLEREKRGANRRPWDYVLTFPGAPPLIIEYQYVDPPIDRYLGRGLESLYGLVPPDAKFLVVVNAKDVVAARKNVQNALGNRRADVVCWRGPEDDVQLGAAIHRLLSARYFLTK